MSKRKIWIGWVPPELEPAAEELCKAVIAEYPTARVGITDSFADNNLRLSFVMLSEKWGKELRIDRLLSSADLENWRLLFDALRDMVEQREEGGPPKEVRNA